MHFRDFNAIAAELHEGDHLQVRLSSGEVIVGELTRSPELASPVKNGALPIKADGPGRRLTAGEITAVDLVV